MNQDRRGFTLTELIVVTVLGALLVMAALQVLITNQRTYTAQTAQIQGQQATRAAMDILSNELREVSAQGGDIISMSSSSIRIRSMRKFGAVCSLTTANPPVLRVLRVGGWFAQNDSVFIFADNNTSLSADDRWVAARVSAVDTTVLCGASKAQNLSFSGQSSKFTKPTGDSVRVGAPVRSFEYYTYSLITYDGRPYLGRTDPGGATVPLVGPVKESNGVSFRYLDSLNVVTATPAAVRQIEVIIRTSSSATNSLGQPVSDSIKGRIYTRN